MVALSLCRWKITWVTEAGWIGVGCGTGEEEEPWTTPEPVVWNGRADFGSINEA